MLFLDKHTHTHTHSHSLTSQNHYPQLTFRQSGSLCLTDLPPGLICDLIPCPRVLATSHLCGSGYPCSHSTLEGLALAAGLLGENSRKFSPGRGHVILTSDPSNLPRVTGRITFLHLTVRRLGCYYCCCC